MRLNKRWRLKHCQDLLGLSIAYIMHGRTHFCIQGAIWEETQHLWSSWEIPFSVRNEIIDLGRKDCIIKRLLLPGLIGAGMYSCVIS